MRLEVSEDQADRLEGVTFAGTGVSIAAADTGMGIATLDGDGWKAGERSVEHHVRDDAQRRHGRGGRPGRPGRRQVSARVWDRSVSTPPSSPSSQLQAMEDGEATDSVIGEFQLSVTATDKFGNPSMKIGDTIDADTDAEDDVHASIAIEFSSTNSQVQVPAGRQEIVAGANLFDAIAPSVGQSRDRGVQ